jgi:four helix bundle protein
MNAMDLEEQLHFYNSGKDFTSLRCWKDAREVKVFFYHEVLPFLPPNEKYNLDIQIRKASCSITSNIAEGHGRFHFQEAIQFYRISRASLSELKDHIISCHDLGYICEKISKLGIGKIEKAKVSINGFINYNFQQIQKFKK